MQGIKEAKPRVTLRANTQRIDRDTLNTASSKEAQDPAQAEMPFTDKQIMSSHVNKVGEPIAFSSAFTKSAYYKPKKRQISIRIDEDVLAWFKNQPGKYQKRINHVCRAYMLANLAPAPSQQTEPELVNS